MFLTEHIAKKSMESLLLCAYTIDSIGFSYGKTGIAVALFKLAEYFNDKKIENHALELLREVLIYDVKNNNFRYGKTGIAFALQYLINYKLLDADYLELYEQQHNEIIKYLGEIQYNENEIYDYIDYLFFITISAYVSKKELIKITDILTDYIIAALQKFQDTIHLNILLFYSYATKILSTLNILSKVKKSEFILQKIAKIHEQLTVEDSVCKYPLFIVKFYVCALRHEIATDKTSTNVNKLYGQYYSFCFKLISATGNNN